MGEIAVGEARRCSTRRACIDDGDAEDSAWQGGDG